jgi:Uri superfamily endonuclease
MSKVKGIYVLVISVGKDMTVNVGTLGCVKFEKGFYAYVGSAQNNLEKRVERHLKKAERKFWHIDYLLDNDAVKVLKVLYKKAGKHEECQIAEKINERGIGIRGFGSSDCDCQSHLIRIKD